MLRVDFGEAESRRLDGPNLGEDCAKIAPLGVTGGASCEVAAGTMDAEESEVTVTAGRLPVCDCGVTGRANAAISDEPLSV